jgi:protein involved in polysaccharide export with SLBB domain
MKKLLTFLLAFAALAQMSHADLQKNMKIGINIMGVPQQEQARINNPQYQIDGNGNIRMWEIGTIRAAGLTTTQLAQKIEQAYKAAQIYTSPSIQVSSDAAETQGTELVTLSGKVTAPGPIQYTKGMTLAQAIAAARGPSTFGTTKRVFVYRDGKKYTLSPLTNDKHKLERVYPGDTIQIDQVKAWESGGQ